MAKKTYPSGVITPELGSTNWYSDYDTNSLLLDSNITKTNSLDSKVKELETSYKNVETSLTSLSAVAKSGDYNDLSNKPESIALAEKAVADGDNNVITKTYATKKEVVTSLEPYVKKTELADVATSGSYTDLSDKPTTIAHADRATADKNGDVITVTYAKKTEIPNLDGYALSKDISKVGKTNNYKDLDNLPTIPSLDGYVTNVELSPVAKSGDYNDLSNTPEPVDLTPYATKSELTTKADDANVVHKSGTETIVGTKTFSSNLYLKMTNLESNTTTPTSAQYKHITVVANNDSQLGNIQFSKRADGSFDTTIYSHGGSDDINNGTLRITSNNEVYSLKSISKLGTSEAKWSEVWAKTFNGNLVTSQINVSNNSSLLRIFGGTSANTGANLDLYGQDASDNCGSFIMRARNSSGYKALIGKIDGSLTWNSNKILTIVNGVTLDTVQTITGAKTFTPWTTFSNGIDVKWITGNKEQKDLYLFATMTDRYQGYGASLRLYSETLNGGFQLTAKNKDGTNVKTLTGDSNGSLKWSSFQILFDTTRIALCKNFTGADIKPGGAINCGNGNGNLKQWYLNADGTFLLSDSLLTGIWKSTSFVTLAPNEGGIFIKLT